jgi:predicted DNA-binding transcriptional regulator AlpA
MTTPAPIDLDSRLTLTAREAGQVLGIHHSTISRHHKAMGLPTVRLAGRVLFPVAGLRQWVSDRTEVAA